MLFTEFVLLFLLIPASLVSILEYVVDEHHCTAFPLGDYHLHQTTQ